MHLREKALKYGSYLLVFILPLVYFGGRIYPHVASKQFFFYGFVEILAGFWIYTLVTDRSYRLTKKSLVYFIPMASFLAWMTIAGILAVNSNLSFWSSLNRGTGLLTLYHSALFALIIASLIRRYGISYLYGLLQWFVGGSFILAISVWLGSEGLNFPYAFLQTDGGGGLMGNSSAAAEYLMFAPFFGAFLF